MATSNPPTTLVPLIGRDSELEQLAGLLRGGGRLITLLGPPGIGKTRLAIEAHRGFEGGAAWVDLSTTTSSSELCARVAHGLGVRLSWLGVGGDMVDEIGYAIDGQGPSLLVLDEAEHCRDAIRDVVPRWLAAAERSVALVTSRERLGVPGEVVLELGPLSVEPPLTSASAQLLLQHGEPPTDATQRAALGELVRALDGIPLALELVAARLRVLAPAELVQRFEAMGLAALGERAGSPLLAALEDSWSRLEEPERAALLRCAVFAGSFDTAAAEAVIGEGAIDHLQRLRDGSLLARQDGRHRLYAPVRAFADGRLDAELRAEAERAHVRHFAALARRLREEVPRDVDALRRLTREIDELRAAHGRADDTDRRELGLGITEVLVTRGPATEALALLEKPDGPAERVARARALQVCGRVGEAVDELERARPELEGRALAESLAMASAAELARGRLEPAGALAAQACEVAPEDGSRVDATRQRAIVAHARGELREAARDYEAARALAEQLELPHRVGQLEVDIGAVRLAERRLEEAEEHYEAAIAKLDPALDPVALGLAEGNLAILEQELGQLDRAAELHARGIERLKRIGHRLYVAHLLGYAGAVEHERGALDAAAQRYGEALRGLRRVGDARLTALVAAMLAAAEATRGRRDAAEESLAEAREALERVEDPGVHRAVELHALQVAMAQDETVRAEATRALTDAEADPVVQRSDDARLAARLLALRVGHGALTLTTADHRVTLPDGETIELASRAVLWRLVQALGEARAKGESLDVHALLQAGWPGESPTGASGLNRVKVALSTLRKLGLREVLVRTDDGYTLDPDVPLVKD